MNTQYKKEDTKGFTLVELLIVLGIIIVIVGVVLVSIKSSKDKAADTETKKIISEVALKAEEQEIAPGVIDYEKAFTTVGAPAAITELATKLNLSASDYQYVATPTSYAIVFPLRKGSYYCIDSSGRATGKEVVGLFELSGPQDCSHATRVVSGGGGGTPVYSGTPDIASVNNTLTLDMSAPSAVGNISLTINEVGNNPTTAPLNVRIFKQSGFTYTTSTPGWTKSAEDSLRATFTTSDVIPANGSTGFTITMTRNANFFNHGQSNANLQILLGSGGDTNSSNNGPVPSSTTINY